MSTKRVPQLRWHTAKGVWHASTNDAPMSRLSRLRAAYGANLGAALYRPFAIVRPERDAGGGANPSTGRWLAILDAGRARAGLTSFDMTTTHDGLEAAVLHVEALAALDGIEVVRAAPTTIASLNTR
jgi:hypothetical protein